MGLKGNAIFLNILLPVLAGIEFGLFLPPAHYIYYTLLLLCSLLIMVLLTFHLWYRRYHFYLHRWVPGLFSQVFLFIAFGAIAVGSNPLYRSDHFSKHPAEAFIVRISSEPQRTNKTLRFEAAAEQGFYRNRSFRLTGKMIITAYTGGASYRLQEGDRLIIPSVYEEIPPPLNPFEFNYKQYLADHGICCQAFLSPDQLQPVKVQKEGSITGFASGLRKQMVRRFTHYIKDKDAAAIASTLILGYKSNLSSDILKAYSGTGVMHVLSVSGMHVALVMVMLTRLLWFMSRHKKLKIVQALLLISAVWFYTLLTGLSAAACRAALMISFLICGKAINRESNAGNCIAASAVLLLLFNPYYLKDTGFQLSYLAVIGLVYLYPKIYHSVTISNWCADKIWSYTALSLSAQVATFPLCLYYFNQFPLYFLAGNLFVVLPVALVMYAGVIFLMIPLKPVSEVLGWFIEKEILLINKGLFSIETLPHAVIHGPKFSLWYYCLIYVSILLLVLWFVYRKRVSLYAAFITVLILTAVNSFQSVYLSYQKKILFCSIAKNTVIGFFDGRTASLISTVKADSKAYSYSVNPIISALNFSDLSFYQPGKALNAGNLYSDGYFYAFCGQRLLLWDRSFNRKTYSCPVSVNYLYLTQNPDINIEQLCRYVKFDLLLIGNDNSAYRIDKWEKQAMRLKARYYVLKNSPALELDVPE